MAHTMNDALYSDLEDRVGELAEIRHLLYLLSSALESSFGRDQSDAPVVKLTLSRDMLNSTIYIAGDAWLRIAKLHEALSLLLDESSVDGQQLAEAA